MSEGFLNMIFLAIAFLMLFGSAEVAYHFLRVKADVTRKIVHVGTGLLTLLFPPLLDNHWLVLALCGSFLVILILSLVFHLLPSINKVDRVTRGSLLFPIIVYACFLLYQQYDSYVYYYIPILILTLCDPVAELVGKNFPWIRYTTFGHSKTISGCLGFFFAAFIVSFTLLMQFTVLSLMAGFVLGFLIALITTVAEGLSHKGYDNLTIPLSANALLIIAHQLEYL